MDIFKTLLVVIVAAAVLGIVGNILGLFSFTPSADEIIRQQLRNAETKHGEFFSNEVHFTGGSGLSVKNFETGRRIMGFECNTASICCPESQPCKSSAIEWDSKRVSVKEEKTITVSSRCEVAAGLFSCKSYFGEMPAQLVIEKILFKQEYDIGKENPKMTIVYRNIGAQPALQSEIFVEVFARFLEQGVEKKTLIEGRTLANTANIPPSQSLTSEIELVNLTSIGRFEAAITVRAKNAGYDTNSVRFSTFKSAGNCRAEKERQKDVFWIESITCGERHYCSGCEFGFQCAEAWEQAGITGLEVGNSSFAYKKIDCPE